MPGMLRKGALPRDDDGTRPVIEDYLRSASSLLPAVPDIVVDRATGDAFGMYLNDTLGDCTVADMFNLFTAVSCHSGRVRGGIQFTDAEAEKVYCAVSGYVPGNPATDNGATLQAVCGYGVSTGFTDAGGTVHKIAGWAEVRDYTDLALLRQLAYVFGAVYLGVAVSAADQAATGKGLPWTLPSAGANVGPDGIDHCVALCLSGEGAVPAAWDETGVATWGQLQKMNDAWALTNTGEAVVVITDDWLQANGVYTIDGLDMARLLADSRGL